MALNVIVDLSHFNNVTDFNTVKADGIVGVIHKATEGINYVDPKYVARRSEALAAGLWWGAYHFATGDDARVQADAFVTAVNPGLNDLLVLDFEQNTTGSSMTLAGAEQFVTQVQAMTGRWPAFYSGSYIKQLLGGNQNATLANCWFWLSEYGPEAHVPANWPTWTMWQYTDGQFGPQPHSVNGIGNCDRDQFNGDMDGLQKLWGYSA
ncbi:MAG TPA: glycoside hydrolase family 25 protein [Pyrinomonadaceae bacterium]|jgi:lysozyme